MKAAMMLETTPRLTLQAESAAELMTANPVSVREDATLKEALGLLIDKGFSAAPVIDKAGRPVGVLSRSDILIHERESPHYLKEAPEFFHKEDLKTNEGEALGKGFQVEQVDRTRVREMMTPAIFTVVAGHQSRPGGQGTVDAKSSQAFRGRRQRHPGRRHFDIRRSTAPAAVI